MVGSSAVHQDKRTEPQGTEQESGQATEVTESPLVSVSSELSEGSFPERSGKKTPLEKIQELDSIEVEVTLTDYVIDVTLNGVHPEKGPLSANVHCKKSMSGTMMIVESSGAQGGGGPLAYDIAMELATERGLSLAADRGRVSDEAYEVWKYYQANRPDVDMVELSVGDWYHGHRAEGPEFDAMQEDRATWPARDHPIWSLWSGFQKEPEIINALQKMGSIDIRDRRGES